MIPTFNYIQMQTICAELQQKITTLRVLDCFPNDLHRFWLKFGDIQRSQGLFFCLQTPFQRLHLVDNFPSAKSTHPFNFFLKDAILLDVALPRQDRIIHFTFQTNSGKRCLIAEFFSKGPNYYLLESDGSLLFSLKLPKENSIVARPTFSNSTSQYTSAQLESIYHTLEQNYAFLQVKKRIENNLIRQLNKLENKKQALKNQLIECELWQRVQHEGELIKANLTIIKQDGNYLVHDWESDQPYHLALNTMQTIQEQMQNFFRRAKKLKAGITPLTEQLKKNRCALEAISQQQIYVSTITTLHELLTIEKTLPIKQTQVCIQKDEVAKSRIYREYISANGIKIFVGKNARTNDQLTFRLANGRDWWLHARDYSGSHVIIRMNKDQQPDEETMKDAMQLAIYYSKGRERGAAEVCITQKKYLLRMNKPGQVQFSQHRSQWIQYDQARLKSLKMRTINPHP